MQPLLILILAIIAIAVYAISIYNSLQTLKTQIVAAIQEIGNQLKRQASLIPNLQNTVKAHLKHEKSVYKLLTDARKAVEAADKSATGKNLDRAENALQSLLPKLQVVVESNPEMKSDKTISNFMRELSDTADKLMYARRTVIDLSQNYNQKLVVFPSNLIANAFGFKKEKGIATPQTGQHVEVSGAEMEDVKVDL